MRLKNFLNFANKIYKSFLYGLYPEKCFACDEILIGFQKNLPFCPLCNETIIEVKEPLCVRCGLPFEDGINRICGGCLSKEYFFDCARALYLYGGAIKDAIHKFKYEKRWYYYRKFGELMADFLSSTYFPSFDIVIPVPLHKLRLSQRGYNQTYLLSKIITKIKKIKLENSVLKKVKKTDAQGNLTLKERKLNVKGAFEIQNSERIKNKSILLIDDVFTTGWTLSECARVLKMHGALLVYALTIARTDLQS